MGKDRQCEQDGLSLRQAVERAAVFKELTPRELDVLSLIGKGLTNNEIAAELYISPHTVKNHVTSIYRKTGIDDRTQLAILVQQQRR